jgi:segregation and condensation protein B
MPKGWVLDRTGAAVTDPATALKGLTEGTCALAPLGGIGDELAGYKGYGWATVVEILSAALQQGAFLKALSNRAADGSLKPYHLGHFFMAVDISAFCDPAAFKKTTGDILRELRASKKAAGHDRIWTAGEKEHDAFLKRDKEGVPLNPAVRESLEAVRNENNVKFTFSWEKLALATEIALLEAVNYLDPEPVTLAKLEKLTGLPRESVSAALDALAERCRLPNSGVELTRMAEGWLLSPKAEYWDILRDTYGKKNEGKLSRAALETLSIVAYSQPITRSEIEAIRGASPDNMLRLLMDKDLVREVGKKDVPGKPAQYGTTKEFLRFFRLESIADLPKLPENEAERFELEKEKQ